MAKKKAVSIRIRNPYPKDSPAAVEFERMKRRLTMTPDELRADYLSRLGQLVAEASVPLSNDPDLVIATAIMAKLMRRMLDVAEKGEAPEAAFLAWECASAIERFRMGKGNSMREKALKTLTKARSELAKTRAAKREANDSRRAELLARHYLANDSVLWRACGKASQESGTAHRTLYSWAVIPANFHLILQKVELMVSAQS